MARAACLRVAFHRLVGGIRLTQARNVTDESARLQSMEQAFAQGDHESARRHAKALLTSDDTNAHEAARKLLMRTEPDRVVEVFALLGLGVVALLVYKYVL